MDQMELSSRAGIGRVTLARIEKGEHSPRTDDGTTYTATVTPTQGGTVTVSVGHSAATSTDGYRSVGIHPLYLRLQAPPSS